MNDQNMEHLTAEEVTRFLERTLTSEERARVVGHMDDCQKCRDEVVQARRVVRSGTRRPRWLYAIPAVTAAALVLFFTSPEPAPLVDATAVRGEEQLRIPVMAPVNDAVVLGDSVVFTWRGTGSGTEYTFTMTGTTGRIVLERSTVDTTLVVPVVPALTRGSTYFWYVDAVLVNGEPATTGTHRFMISP